MSNAAYIIGGGSSLKALQDDAELMEVLSDKDTIGCNVAAKHFDTYYMIYHDPKIEVQFAETIKSFNGAGGVFAPVTAKGDDQELSDKVNYFKRAGSPRCDMGDLFTGNNCGTAAVSLAVALGYDEIYLLGIDCRFNPKTNDSHFHNDYKTDNDVNSYGGYDQFFRQLGDYINNRYPNVKLFNCSYISEMDMSEKHYKRLSLKEAILGL